jgi:imidazolonepropionase-like amidohydrolase
LVVTNARILDGAGSEIANGTIVVEGGVIRSVRAGGAPAGSANVVDAGGRTVIRASSMRTGTWVPQSRRC